MGATLASTASTPTSTAVAIREVRSTASVLDTSMTVFLVLLLLLLPSSSSSSSCSSSSCSSSSSSSSFFSFLYSSSLFFFCSFRFSSSASFIALLLLPSSSSLGRYFCFRFLCFCFYIEMLISRNILLVRRTIESYFTMFIVKGRCNFVLLKL